MIGFNATMQAEQGSDVSSLIAQILADNVMALSQKNKLAVEVFDKIVRRSLGKTGSTIFKSLKSGFKDGTLNIEPLRKHPLSGATMTDTLDKYRPWMLTKDTKIRPVKTNRKPGLKFAGMMQYEIDDHDGKNLTVGLIPKRRGGDKWAKRFKDWQEAGNIDTSIYPRTSAKSMFNYFKALGMPITKAPARPQRDIIGKIETRENPVAMFEKFFLERLLK